MVKKREENKSYHEKFLNSELAWDRNSLSQADIVSGVLHLIENDTV